MHGSLVVVPLAALVLNGWFYRDATGDDIRSESRVRGHAGTLGPCLRRGELHHHDWIPVFAGMTKSDVSVRFSTAC